MNSFIDREIAKVTINEDEVIVCMYVFQSNVLNISFFESVEYGYTELLRHDVTPEYGKELMRKVRANEVEKVSPLELKEFTQFLNKHHYSMSRNIKNLMNKSLKELKVDYIGEMAGLYYIVSTHLKRKIKQMYLLQQSKGQDEFEIGRVPTAFIELILLDYIHHASIGNNIEFIMINENEFIGLRKSNNNIINVVKIEVFPDSVSASKAYMISRKNQYEYVLLPFEKNTPELMENLKVDGEKIIKEFVKKINLISK